MNVSATELKNRFGKYLDLSQTEPVVVEKTGRQVAVVLSFNEYERLSAIDDAYWASKAFEAEADGFAGPEASMKFLKDKYDSAGSK